MDTITKDNFKKFEDDPEKSILLYHLNSGHQRFHAIDQLLHSTASLEEHGAALEYLKQEIKTQALTVKEKEDLVKEYLKS